MWFMISAPVKKILWKIRKPAQKINTLINLLLFMTFVGLFQDHLFWVLSRIRFNFGILFWSMLSLLVIFYIVKYADKRFGEGWKPSWYRFLEMNGIQRR